MPPHPSSDPSPYQYPYPPLRSQEQQRQQYYHQPLPNSSPGSSPPSRSPLQTPYAYDNDNNDTAYTPKTGEEARILVRTPSPTPSEAKELQTGYYVILVIILVLVALITIFHKQIVFWLAPATRWLHDLKLGWLVPIGILFVISFPPLFGHEIVAILCGLVWGMWVGFGIVAAGTFLGEVGNFYAFKYCCRARGEKLEKGNITYACLAKVVRDGGFKIALIARLSAIPGHFTTAIFSTCGMGIFVFSLAAILSMPKQFITVYLGVLLQQSATGSTDTKSRIISDVVLAITILITFLAMWYIYHMMNKVKPQVIYDRRKARQAKLARAASSATAHSSDDGIPLTLQVQPPSMHRPSLEQDADHDPGYLYSPQPHRAGRLPAAHASDDVELGYSYAGNHSRTSNDDVSWDMSGAPMQHAGTGREVAGLGGGYGYTYGSSSDTLGGSGSTDTLTPSQGQRGGEAEGGEFGHGLRHGHMAELTGASYRTARDELDDDLRNPYAERSRRPPGAGAASPPPPSYRTNLG
ncbi:hypothetical protein C0995_012705 [Termitomyces sp. Mi166|nr:hypothetical protein C0995_012705 [Termitomyces sp. Mi166\